MRKQLFVLLLVGMLLVITMVTILSLTGHDALVQSMGVGVLLSTPLLGFVFLAYWAIRRSF